MFYHGKKRRKFRSSDKSEDEQKRSHFMNHFDDQRSLLRDQRSLGPALLPLASPPPAPFGICASQRPMGPESLENFLINIICRKF